MARLALAAHDPGGAAVLAAAAPALRDAGHDLAWLPAGPAAKLWHEAGETVSEALDVAAATATLERLAPDLLVTGTSFHDGFERALWAAARRLGVPSFAVLDAWSNIARRFQSPDGSREQPDAFGVMDEATRADVAAAGWCRARLFVIGQPHLAARTERLKQRRQNRHGGVGRQFEKQIVFFSEPILEDFGPTARGFTQFEVATLVAEVFTGSAAVRLAIKPHPRESEVVWLDWLANVPNVRLATEETEAILGVADGVLGMTTMVLLEACLAGIPALSLQPGRPTPANPIIDSMLPIITRRADAAGTLSAWVAGLTSPPPPPPSARDILAGGGARMTEAVYEILTSAGSKA